jgi:thioredoxin-like negative regulator of GroEL
LGLACVRGGAASAANAHLSPLHLQTFFSLSNSGHCQRLKPEWAKAASELKGQVKFGQVDTTVHQSLASQYGVRGYPTIKVFL